MYFGLSTRIGTLISVVLLAAVMLIVLLNFRSFEATQSTLLEGRIHFILFEIKESLEDALSIGIPLEGGDSTGKVLAQLQRLDDQIVSVEVFNREGVVLFSTDQTFINEVVSERWLESRIAAEGEVWSRKEHDTLVTGVEILDPQGNVNGSVVVQYLISKVEQTISRVGWILFQTGLFLLIGMAFLAFVGSRLFMAPLCGRLGTINAVGKKLLEYVDSPQATLSRSARVSSARVTAAGNKQSSIFEQFRQQVLDALQKIEQTRAEVQRLDED